jgi:WD40 repeat protein
VTHVYIWDVLSATLLARLPGYSYAFVSLSFFPDGRRFISGLYHGMLRIWDSETQMATSSLEVRRSPVSTVAFFADGRRLLSVGTFDVCIWDTSTGALLVVRPDQVTFATISPSGDHILSVTGGSGSIWSSVDGHLLGSFAVESETTQDHSDSANHNDNRLHGKYNLPEITHTAFSLDGSKIATFVAFSEQDVYPKMTTYEMRLWHGTSGAMLARTKMSFAIDQTGLTFFPEADAVFFPFSVRVKVGLGY